MRALQLVLFLGLGTALFGGQSLVLGPTSTGTLTDPVAVAQVDITVEFQLHGIVYPAAPNQVLFRLVGSGVLILLQPFNGGSIQINDGRDGIAGGVPCTFAGLPASGNYLFRVRRDHTNMVFTCEVWSFDGTGYQETSEPITRLGAGSLSGTMLGGGATADIGFLRVLFGLVPLASQPPTTAHAGPEITELKFDGTLLDSSGNGNNATATNISYIATPNQNAFAIAKTNNAPVWSNWGTQRAGFPAQLDGTASYSLADQSSTVNYFWQQLSGPTAVRWDSRYYGKPTISGMIFGTYSFLLKVSDANASVATTTLQFGAVAMDDNGVIINANPAVDQIFGNMIAYGSNPWGWEDNRHYQAFVGQTAYLATNWAPSLTWTTAGSGTVSYPFSGIGPYPGTGGTTLSSGITATATSIPIANAAALPGLANLPTWVLIGNAYTAQEIVRVTGTTATSGPATLTVAYDGRGVAAGATNAVNTAVAQPATAWAMGTAVGEYRISGAGTHFVTDSTRPLCPAGAIGPPGAVVYSSGTVTLSAGSTAVTGSGTAWSGFAGDWIRVSATHGGGTAFIWWAQIVTDTSGASLVASRPAPSDIDATGFAYAITTPRFASLGFTAPNGAPEQALQNLWGCESDTAAFGGTTHDIPALDGTTQSGMTYSYKDSLGSQSFFGPNFYGTGLALRSFYYRSGYTPALTLANSMDDYWAKDPELCAGYCSGIPLNYGGGVTGAAVNATLNASALIGYQDLGGFVALGPGIAAAGCNVFDTRDSSAEEMATMFAALYDPNSTRQTAAQGVVANILTREQGCAHADNSWANSANFFQNAPSGPLLTLTNGSTTVTGTGLTPGMCYVTASVTVTVRAGSAAITGSGLIGPSTFTDGWKITIVASRHGQPYVGIFSFIQSGGASGTLGALWPGDSGTFSAVIEPNDNFTTIGANGNDSMLKEAWACTYVSSTQLTLNRPWDGPSGSSYIMLSYIGPGYQQQPFMLGGYKSNVLRFGALNSATSAGFQTLLNNASTWLKTYGYDAQSQGMNYERVFGLNPANNVTGACEPTTVQSSNAVIARTPNCQGGANSSEGVQALRVLSAEGGLGEMQSYLANATPANKNFVDTVYGSLWGNCSYTQPGLYCDANIPNGENSNASLASFKWPGFFFGLGGFFSNSWPAVRIGGVSPAKPHTVYIDFGLGSAAQAHVLLTAPSGAMQTVNCGSATPCAVTVDDRQGSYWFQIQQLSGGGKVLAVSQPELLPVPVR